MAYLFQLVLTLALIGVFFYLVLLLPMPDAFKVVIRAVGILVAIAWVLALMAGQPWVVPFPPLTR